MHDLILRNRVVGYSQGDLTSYLHGPPAAPLAAAQRLAFEHHLPNSNILAALTLDAWPHLLAAMRRRSTTPGSWSGGMDARQKRLAQFILAEISARGALCSDDIDDDQRDHQGWGAHASLAKTTLHKLFFHGRVLISRRVANRRYYDLPERVLPSAVVGAMEPSAVETEQWQTLLKLRQRRFVSLGKSERQHVAEFVQQVEVDGCPPLFCLREDLPLLDLPAANPEPMLLAPLDPLIYDRRLTRVLWNYDYTWEVYTPPARRVRGYYALPVLAGLQLVGHVDPKADRSRRKMVIVNRSLRRGYRAANAIHELASFLGLRSKAKKSSPPATSQRSQATVLATEKH